MYRQALRLIETVLGKDVEKSSRQAKPESRVSPMNYVSTFFERPQKSLAGREVGTVSVF
jgi:hypothetical protein